MSGITNFLCRPTGAEVVALCETVTDKNFVTDAEKTQIGVDTIQTADQVKAAVESFTAGDRINLDNFQEGTDNKVFSAAEETKLGYINLGASAATDTEIVALVEAAGTLTADAVVDGVTNKAFTAIEDTKLSNINLGASAATGTEIVALVEAAGTLTADAVVDGTTNKAFTAIEDTKLSNIDLGASAATGTEIVALVQAAGTLTADAVVDGATNKMLTDTERGQLTALVAATPQFELLENTFDIATAIAWVDAIPVGSVLIELKYINLTAIDESGAASYKINLTGGVTADLESGIDFAQNTKKVVGIAETAIPATTDVNLTANAGTLDSGSVKVGLLVRKASENYPSV